MGEVGLNRFCGNVVSSGFYCQLFVLLVTVLLVGLGLGSCAAGSILILRSQRAGIIQREAEGHKAHI
jgi:hypothetical protein